MARRKTVTDNHSPLIMEPHPKEYSGLPFLTLIQYRNQHMLTIVDTVDTDVVRAYVLDLCGAESISEDIIIEAAHEWYTHDRGNFPISIAFSRDNLTSLTSKVYRSLNIEFISRVIGPMPHFPMKENVSVKRRRRRSLPANVEIHKITSN